MRTSEMSTRRLLTRPGILQAAPLPKTALHAFHTSIRLSSTAPATVVEGTFWRSLVPKPFRKENRTPSTKKARQWNPATFFIAIFLLIGSMSIQMITLRHSFERYMRQSEARITKLRDVVERIQRGETVDVEQALGTGNAKKEADWEEMLKAIERDEAARKSQKQEKAKEAEPTEKAATITEIDEPAPTSEAAPRRAKTGNLGNFF
ncbi:hypothetical protein B0J13DRAFT_616776 [Dactylonectria estremocensis]|uniref:Uncharacterized protein n=1 Tax=Dactylonectria estremocensis TaxID=1079267 RepID=A0A9P9JAZ7_9HYPO|nr:hypothetical protein B0J13DRAFT_616776 [Dactylonectria estremocensis]